AGGTTAAQAQVVGILLCPSDLLTETVVELTPAVWRPPAWSRGFYGISSYGGNAGKRSVPIGDPPDFPRISRDRIFFIESCVRLADITDGSSHTLFFGERYHRDPEYDLLRPLLVPGTDPSIAQLGKWGFVAGPGGCMTHLTLHTAARINYRVPPGG